MTAEQLESIISTTADQIKNRCEGRLQTGGAEVTPDHQAFHDFEDQLRASQLVRSVSVVAKLGLILGTHSATDIIVQSLQLGIEIGKAISEFESLEQLHSREE